MSLLCHECGLDIKFGEPLFSVGTDSSKSHSAICKNCIVPKKFWSQEKSKIIVYSAKSKENFNGSYSLCDFEIDEILGYLPDEEVKEYLKNTARDYLPKSKWKAKTKHNKNCECGICNLIKKGMTQEEAFEAFEKWEREAIEKHGWFVHFIGDDNTVPFGTNAHTHGLFEKFGQLDLQIVMPVQDKIIHSLFWNAVRLLEKGLKFEDGDVVDEICGGNFKVKFVKAEEDDREILRMILPDKYGNLDYMSFEDDRYNMQYAGLT